jgi:hypothetical protein
MPWSIVPPPDAVPPEKNELQPAAVDHGVAGGTGDILLAAAGDRDGQRSAENELRLPKGHTQRR